jgi:putative zinc finger/helix-turn-helix YgiT family protein
MGLNQERNQDRPFPWRCGTCGAKTVYRVPISYSTSIKYEGRPYDLEIPDLQIPKCQDCGELVFDNTADEQISRVLRSKLGLLQPDQIRAGRTELGLNQKDFATCLGVAEESVCRWETGRLIQSRVVDRQIRLFFEFPAVREALGELQQGETFGEIVRTEAARSLQSAS